MVAEERQRAIVSPPGLRSSKELTGTTDNVTGYLSILGIPLLNHFPGHVRMENFFPPHPEESVDSFALSQGLGPRTLDLSAGLVFLF